MEPREVRRSEPARPGVGSIPMPPLRSVIVAVACVVVAILAAGMFMAVWASTEPIQRGQDLEFYRSVAVRWLETGVYYLPRQLDGTGSLTLNLDVLYPPSALFLFVPFVWLPAVLWWAGPMTIVGASFARLRPARWTWPILILSLAWRSRLRNSWPWSAPNGWGSSGSLACPSSSRSAPAG